LAGLLFGEDQGRYVVETSAAEAEKLVEEATARGVSLLCIGQVGGTALTLPGGTLISVSEMRSVHEAGLPRLMGEA
jgi:hypothetical protein